MGPLVFESDELPNALHSLAKTSLLRTRSPLVVWFEPIPEMADITSEGSEQTALKCSLFRASTCHQCHAV